MPQKPPALGLQAELKQDAAWLKNGHIEHNKHINFSLFKKYALMDLSDYKFSQFVSGNQKVSKWQSPGKNQLILYKIETTISVDTTLASVDSIWVDGKKVAETTNFKQVYQLVTFIIIPQYGSQLVYITHKKGGLYKYTVRQSDVYPVYEALDWYLKSNERVILNKIKQAAFK